MELSTAQLNQIFGKKTSGSKKLKMADFLAYLKRGFVGKMSVNSLIEEIRRDGYSTSYTVFSVRLAKLRKELKETLSGLTRMKNKDKEIKLVQDCLNWCDFRSRKNQYKTESILDILKSI